MTQTGTNFEDFFTKSRAEVPKPAPLPRGHYTLVLRGTVRRAPKTADKSGVVSFGYEAIEPHDDVDPSELAAFESENRSIKDNRIWFDMWLKDWKDVSAIYDHVALHGVDVEGSGDLNVALKAAANKRIVAYVCPETYQHPVKGLQTKDTAQGFKALN